MSDGTGDLSRRSALLLLGAGTGLVASGTMGFTHVASDRGTTVDVATDDSATIGLISGPSTLHISNNLESQISVTASPNDTSTVFGSSTITLDQRITGEPNPGTHPFLFDPADTTTTFDVTVTVSEPGFQLQQTKTIAPANDLPADNAVQLLIDETNTNAHTWNVADAASPLANVTEIEVDYSGLNQTDETTFLDNTRAQDVAVTVTDTGGALRTIRIDWDQLTSVSIGGSTITIPLQDTFNFDNNDMNRLLVSLGRVAAVDGAEDGSATLTVRDGTGGSSTATVSFNADVSYT